MCVCVCGIGVALCKQFVNYFPLYINPCISVVPADEGSQAETYYLCCVCAKKKKLKIESSASVTYDMLLTTICPPLTWVGLDKGLNLGEDLLCGHLDVLQLQREALKLGVKLGHRVCFP